MNTNRPPFQIAWAARAPDWNGNVVCPRCGRLCANSPNALCNPHLGYVEQVNYELYFGTAFDNVVAFADGKPVDIANPEVLARK